MVKAALEFEVPEVEAAAYSTGPVKDALAHSLTLLFDLTGTDDPKPSVKQVCTKAQMVGDRCAPPRL